MVKELCKDAANTLHSAPVITVTVMSRFDGVLHYYHGIQQYSPLLVLSFPFSLLYCYVPIPWEPGGSVYEGNWFSTHRMSRMTQRTGPQ